MIITLLSQISKQATCGKSKADRFQHENPIPMGSDFWQIGHFICLEILKGRCMVNPRDMKLDWRA